MIDAARVVYLSDFRLAKTLESTGLTEVGALVGTPYYMSPEQVKGEAIDPRSDIYSLGIILYEMLTGQLPYVGGSAYEVMIQRVQRLPRPAKELNPDIPQYLQKVLERCLIINKRLRYASVHEILADLDTATVRTSLRYEFRRRHLLRPALAWVLLPLLIFGGWWVYQRERGLRLGARSSSSAVEVVPVVGVVPFENQTGNKSLNWYGEGIARLVADSLAQSRHVRVASAERIDSLRSSGSDQGKLSKAAASSGIDFLLSGELLPGPKGLTLAVRLTETKGGSEVAAQRIDELTPLTVIGAADQISMTARKGLGIPLAERVDVFAADFAARNPGAYESYIAGLQAFDQYDFAAAERNFSAALKKAPDYTMARYRLAHIQAASGRTDEALANIRLAVAEASRLSDREARYVRALEATMSRRNDEAIKAYQELITHYPYGVEARADLAQVFLDTESYKNAIEQAKVMAKLDPQNHTTWSMLGQAHIGLRDFSQAVNDLQRYVGLEPNSPTAHDQLGDCYRSEGEFDLAAEEYGKALALDPAYHFSTIHLAVVDVLKGQQEDAGRALQGLVSDSRALPRQRIDAAFDLAFLRRAQGRFREAARPLETLEKPIAKEKVREATALSLRGNCLMEAGDFQNARRLIDMAIEKSPGVPTRHLFALGLLQLRHGWTTDIGRIAPKILEHAMPQDDPDRTEDKAATYLTGMALLAEGKPDQASEELSRAVALSGYEYGIYRLGLARAYLSQGKLQEAMAAAKQASAPLDPVDPRLDLELDRTRALLVLAEVQKAMGRNAEAAAQARKFLTLWAQADANLHELAEARRLASTAR